MKRILFVLIGTLLFLGLAGIDFAERDECEKLIKVDAAPGKGFNYPYYIFLPPMAGKSEGNCLLVQPNNTGSPDDDLAVHDEDARNVASKSSPGNQVSCKLGYPLLVPVFPRPENEWKTYTHALDRDTIRLKAGDMQRLDLQLLAMVADCRNRLEKEGLRVREKVFMIGFSAAGTFVNRFAVLHPDAVAAAACGGVNGIVMLPLGELDGKTLRYPLGIADYRQIAGSPFDIEAYRKVAQFIFMGADDTNDATLFKDGYDDDEREIVHAVIGRKMLPDRFCRCEQVLRDRGVPVRFTVYPGVGHGTNKQMLADIIEFFKTEAKKSGI